MKRFDLFEWIAKQDPTTMPFRPGARHTAPFGLREHQSTIDAGASPGHVGNDRGREPVAILMPFRRGVEQWKYVGGDAGSLLSITDIDESAKVELQVMHTRNNYTKTAPYIHERNRGEELRAYTSDLGLGTAPHTHAEGVTLFNFFTYEAFVERSGDESENCFYNGYFNTDLIKKHCDRHGLDYDSVMIGLDTQVRTWGIVELWKTFAVREVLPTYRIPFWGRSSTIHFCTKTYLDI